MIAGVRGRTSWLLGLLVALRLAYLGQYLQLPFLFGPVFDSQVYLAQAEAIAAGHLGDPTLLAFSPLYGYFLAILGRTPGDLLPVFAQLALGILNVLLIYRITLALWQQRSVATWASVGFALYGPIMFYESKIMSETLGLFLLLVGVERLVSPEFARGKLKAIAVCGASLGLAVLARASLLFTLPFFVVSAFLLESAPRPETAPRSANRFDKSRRGLGLALVFLLIFGAYGAFNQRQSGLFVPVIPTSNTASQAAQGEWRGDLSAFTDSAGHAPGAWSVVHQARSVLRRSGLDGRIQPASDLERRAIYWRAGSGSCRRSSSRPCATWRPLSTTATTASVRRSRSFT